MWGNKKELSFGEISLADDSTGKIETSFTSDKYIKLRLEMCHAGMNRQGFIIDPEGLSKARHTITNIPVLANVIKDKDGNYCFGSHDMHIEASADGDEEPRLIYDEAIIGVIPETCNYTEEERDGRLYACVDAYVYTWYSNYAQDVLAAHSEVPVSIEMNVNAAYRDESNVMTVTDYSYTGVTLLGDHVTPACIGAKGIVMQLSSDQNHSAFMALCEDVTKIAQQEKEDLKEDTKVNEETKQEATETTVAPTTAEEEPTTTEEATDTAEETEDTEAETTKVTCTLSSIIELGLGNAVRQLKDSDGYPAYYLMDFDADTQKVYMCSYADGFVYMASYAVDGDNVVVKEPLVRQSVEYREWSDSDGSVTKSMSALLSAYRNVEALTTELTELRKEHKEALAAKKQAEITMAAEEFADIAELEEYKTLMSTATSLPSIEDFKKECYAIRGRNIKQLQAAVGDTTKGKLRAPLGLSAKGKGAADDTASSPLEKLAQKYATQK